MNKKNNDTQSLSAKMLSYSLSVGWDFLQFTWYFGCFLCMGLILCIMYLAKFNNSSLIFTSIITIIFYLCSSYYYYNFFIAKTNLDTISNSVTEINNTDLNNLEYGINNLNNNINNLDNNINNLDNNINILNSNIKENKFIDYSKENKFINYNKENKFIDYNKENKFIDYSKENSCNIIYDDYITPPKKNISFSIQDNLFFN